MRKLNPRVLLSLYLNFCQFQPGVAYEIAVYIKKTCTQISCSFGLVLQDEEAGTIIAEPFRSELFSKQFCGGTADLSLPRILLTIRQKLREPSFWEVIDSCFISISKFGSFKNPFAWINNLFKFHFRCGRFILLVLTKEISMSYGNSTSGWKSWKWMRHGLVFTVMGI